MSATRPTVAILYGFCEGPRIGREFEQTLIARGFDIIRNAHTADIIIGHSGGCFLVPEKNIARSIILIGLPYWPGKSTAKGLGQKISHDMRAHLGTSDTRRWLHKTVWNSYYFWQMRHNAAMLRRQKQGTYWQLPARKTLVIRNEHDTVCVPDLENLPFAQKPSLCELPGQHDDCWIHPAIYADIVQSEYATRLLAQTDGDKTAL